MYLENINGPEDVQKLNIDTSHWTGKGWSKDIQLKDWTKYVKKNYIVSYANLTFEQIKTLESLKYNDDFIARYVFGYKGGSVSGSFKNIRKTLKKTFKDLCIY